MKLKVELDLTPDEAKELFVPGDKQTEFTMKLYDAYQDAVAKMIWAHIDPNNFTGMNKK